MANDQNAQQALSNLDKMIQDAQGSSSSSPTTAPPPAQTDTSQNDGGQRSQPESGSQSHAQQALSNLDKMIQDAERGGTTGDTGFEVNQFERTQESPFTGPLGGPTPEDILGMEPGSLDTDSPDATQTPQPGPSGLSVEDVTINTNAVAQEVRRLTASPSDNLSDEITGAKVETLLANLEQQGMDRTKAMDTIASRAGEFADQLMSELSKKSPRLGRTPSEKDIAKQFLEVMPMPTIQSKDPTQQEPEEPDTGEIAPQSVPEPTGRERMEQRMQPGGPDDFTEGFDSDILSGGVADPMVKTDEGDEQRFSEWSADQAAKIASDPVKALETAYESAGVGAQRLWVGGLGLSGRLFDRVGQAYEAGVDIPLSKAAEAATLGMVDEDTISKATTGQVARAFEAVGNGLEEQAQDDRELLRQIQSLEQYRDGPELMRLIGENAPNLLATTAASFATGGAAAAAGAGTAAAGAAAGAAGVGTGTLIEGGAIREEALRYFEENGTDMSEEEKQAFIDKLAFTAGPAAGLIDFIPVGKLMSRVGGRTVTRKLTRSFIRNAIEQSTKAAGRTANQAFTEGTTEIVQESIANAAAQTYDETRGLFEGTAKVGLVGVILGGGSQVGIDFSNKLTETGRRIFESAESRDAAVQQMQEETDVSENVAAQIIDQAANQSTQEETVVDQAIQEVTGEQAEAQEAGTVADAGEAEAEVAQAEERANRRAQGEEVTTTLQEQPESTLRARESALIEDVELGTADDTVRSELSNVRAELENRGIETQGLPEGETLEVQQEPSAEQQIEASPADVQSVARGEQTDIEGALEHEQAGSIDLFAGEYNQEAGTGFGIQKIREVHPEALPHLNQQTIENAEVNQERSKDSLTVLEAPVGDQTMRILVDHQLGQDGEIQEKTFVNNAYFVDETQQAEPAAGQEVTGAGLEPAASDISNRRSEPSELTRQQRSVRERSDDVKEGVDKTAEQVEAEQAFQATRRNEEQAQALGKLPNALIESAQTEWNNTASDTFNRLNDRIQNLKQQFKKTDDPAEMRRLAEEADNVAERRDRLVQQFQDRWQQRAQDRRTAERATNRIIENTDFDVDTFQEAFMRSEDRETIGSFAGVNIELGSFGRDGLAAVSQRSRLDRDALEQIMVAGPLTARRGSQNQNDARYENMRWIFRTVEGEMYAVETRLNNRGVDEVVTAWAVRQDPSEFWSQYMQGQPNTARSGAVTIESPQFVQLGNEEAAVPRNKPKSKAQRYRERVSELVDVGREVINEVNDMEQMMQQQYLNAAGVESVDGLTQADETLGNILTELELAEPGERVFEQSEQGDMRVTGASSTFPDWIPEHRRQRKYVDYMLDLVGNVRSLHYPRNPTHTAKIEMADALYAELDKRLGVDTSGIRSQITDTYEQNTEAITQYIRAEEQSQESAFRGEDARLAGDVARQIVSPDPDTETLDNVETEGPYFQRAATPADGSTLNWIEQASSLEDITGEEVEAIREYQNSSVVPSDKIGLIQSAYRKWLNYVNADRYAPTITTDILNSLQGRTVVNKQFIEDLANQKGIKQADADAALETLREMLPAGSDKVNVEEFMGRMSAKLIDVGVKRYGYIDASGRDYGAKFPGVRLRTEGERLNGKYEETIYTQDLFTYPGSANHFQITDGNYFAHTRTEENKDGSLRRLVEVQSDLIKNLSHPAALGTAGVQEVSSLRNAVSQATNVQQVPKGVGVTLVDPQEYNPDQTADQIIQTFELTGQHRPFIENLKNNHTERFRSSASIRQQGDEQGRLPDQRFEGDSVDVSTKIAERSSVIYDRILQKLPEEGDPRITLQPYKNNWWQRIIREEIKRAAQDGVTRYQIPLGDTAMRIQGNTAQTGGLSENNAVIGNNVTFQNRRVYVRDINDDGTANIVDSDDVNLYDVESFRETAIAGLETMAAGTEGKSGTFLFLRNAYTRGFSQALTNNGLNNLDPSMPISQLFDEVTKAVSLDTFARETVENQLRTAADVEQWIFENGRENTDAVQSPTDPDTVISFNTQVRGENVPIVSPEDAETIDTSHGVYRLYEEKIANFIFKNRNEAFEFTDEHGNRWIETQVAPEEAEQPVQAFRRADILQELQNQPISINEVVQQIEDYQGRLGVEFPVFAVRDIFAGDSPHFPLQQRVKNEFERASGVTFAGMIIVSERDMGETTIPHEMVHETLLNWHMYDVFADMRKSDLYRAANGNQDYTANDIMRLQEELAEQYEAFERGEEMSRLPQIVRTYFNRLRILVGRIHRAFGGDRDIIKDYFRTLKYGRSRRQKAIRRQADFESLEEVARTLPRSGDLALDFGYQAKKADRIQEQNIFMQRLKKQFDEEVQAGNLRDESRQDINLFESVMAQTRDIYLKNPMEFHAAEAFEKAHNRRVGNKKIMDDRFSRQLQPYFTLPRKSQQKVDKVLVEGDAARTEYDVNQLKQRDLNQEEIDAYRAVRQSFNSAHEILLNEMVKNGVPLDMINEYRGQITGYIPHKWQHGHFVKTYRFNENSGLWNLIRRDDFRTERAAKAEATRRRKANDDPNIDYAYAKQDALDVNFFEEQGLSVESLKVAISQAQTSEEAKQAVMGAIQNMVKEKGFGRNFIERSGIEGYQNQDMRQPIADYFNGLTGFLTKMRAAKEYKELLQTIDARQQPQFFQYMNNLILYDLGNTKELEWIRNISFTWMLASDLSFLLTNATQNYIVGAGELTKYMTTKQKFTPKAEQMIVQAQIDWNAMQTSAGVSNISGMNLTYQGLSNDEQAAVNALLRRAKLGGEMMSDLMGFKNNPLYSGVVNGLQTALYKSTTLVERDFNRIPAFLAARRLFKEQGYDNAQANEMALKVAEDIHFRYGKGNRRPIMRGRAGSTIFVYHNYIFSLLFNLYRDLSRKEFMSFARKMLYTGFVGGTTALPFVGTMIVALRQLFGFFDDEEELEEINAWERAWEKGVPAALTGVDMSGRVGIDLISIESVIENPENIFSYLGAAGSLVPQAYSGINLMFQGRHLESFEKLAPDILGNPSGALAGYWYGVTSTAGVPLTRSDGTVYRYNTLEALIAGAGFTPTNESYLWDEKAKEWSRQGHEQAERTEVRRSIRGMIQRGEFDRAQEAQQEAKQNGVIGEETNYVREFAEDDFIEQAMEDWDNVENKSKDKLTEIENRLIEKTLGEDASDRQKLGLRKKFAVRRVFDTDDETVSEFLRKIDTAASNDEKMQILGKYRRELGREQFKKKIWDKGRLTIDTEAGNESHILISDQLSEEYLDNQEALINNEQIEQTYRDGEKESEAGVLDRVMTYANAVGTDPLSAFRHIFNGQTLRRVDRDTIIVERMPLSESQEIRDERGADATTTEMQLDHIVPLQLGGDNTKDNLQLVPVDQHQEYTQVGNFLGGLLRRGEISGDKARSLIKRHKQGEISADKIFNRDF